MIHTEKIAYYMLSETLSDPEDCLKHNQIIRENVTEVNGTRLFTLTWKQVLQSLTRNWNGRGYSKPILTDAYTKNPLVQHDLQNGGLFGEYGHPLIEKGQNELTRQMTIFPPNVCWKVSMPFWEGNLLMGEVTTVAGGYGEMLRDRVLTGTPAMASSRGVGGCDASGNVLPGYTLVCWDAVFRPSHKEAYARMDTVKTNDFNIPTGNSMQESAAPINVQSESFKNFLLTEAVSRDAIGRVCDAMGLDYDSMVLTENSLRITRTDDLNRTTVILPLRKLVGANQHLLF